MIRVRAPDSVRPWEASSLPVSVEVVIPPWLPPPGAEVVGYRVIACGRAADLPDHIMWSGTVDFTCDLRPTASHPFDRVERRVTAELIGLYMYPHAPPGVHPGPYTESLDVGEKVVAIDYSLSGVSIEHRVVKYTEDGALLEITVRPDPPEMARWTSATVLGEGGRPLWATEIVAAGRRFRVTAWGRPVIVDVPYGAATISVVFRHPGKRIEMTLGRVTLTIEKPRELRRIGDFDVEVKAGWWDGKVFKPCPIPWKLSAVIVVNVINKGTVPIVVAGKVSGEGLDLPREVPKVETGHEWASFQFGGEVKAGETRSFHVKPVFARKPGSYRASVRVRAWASWGEWEMEVGACPPGTYRVPRIEWRRREVSASTTLTWSLEAKPTPRWEYRVSPRRPYEGDVVKVTLRINAEAGAPAGRYRVRILDPRHDVVVEDEFEVAEGGVVERSWEFRAEIGGRYFINVHHWRDGRWVEMREMRKFVDVAAGGRPADEPPSEDRPPEGGVDDLEVDIKFSKMGVVVTATGAARRLRVRIYDEETGRLVWKPRARTAPFSTLYPLRRMIARVKVIDDETGIVIREEVGVVGAPWEGRRVKVDEGRGWRVTYYDIGYYSGITITEPRVELVLYERGTSPGCPSRNIVGEVNISFRVVKGEPRIEGAPRSVELRIGDREWRLSPGDSIEVRDVKKVCEALLRGGWSWDYDGVVRVADFWVRAFTFRAVLRPMGEGQPVREAPGSPEGESFTMRVEGLRGVLRVDVDGPESKQVIRIVRDDEVVREVEVKVPGSYEYELPPGPYSVYLVDPSGRVLASGSAVVGEPERPEVPEGVPPREEVPAAPPPEMPDWVKWAAAAGALAAVALLLHRLRG